MSRLLKRYKAEVEALTERAKFAENCFLSAYRLVREAPDPSAALGSAARAVLEAQSEAAAAAQAQAHGARLLADARAELLASRAALAALEAAAAAAPALAAAADDARAKLEIEHADRLEELRSRTEEDMANAMMQSELLLRELELAAERNRALEAALEVSVSASVSASAQTSVPPPPVSAEPSFRARSVELMSRLEEENQSLLREVQAARAEARRLETALAAQSAAAALGASQAEERLAEAGAARDELAQEVDAARCALAGRPTAQEWDQLRARLAVIEREAPPVSDAPGCDTFSVRTLRSISGPGSEKSELVAARASELELRARVLELEEVEARLGEALRDQSELAGRLERDLAAATARLADAPLPLPLPLQLDLLVGEAAFSAHRRPHDTANSLSAAPAAASVAVAAASRTAATAPHLQQQQELQALKSMLAAVCAQRDRLRQQLQAAEECVEAALVEGRRAAAKVRAAEQENVELFARIKFLTSYKASERSTLVTAFPAAQPTDLEGAAAHSPMPVPAPALRLGSPTTGLGRGVEHKYKRLYDDTPSEDPWQSFQDKEMRRRVGTLPIAERLAWRLLNTLLARPAGRLVLVLYAALVHGALLVCALRR
jgi:hypothetical protein